jgi:hypothetical protein
MRTSSSLLLALALAASATAAACGSSPTPGPTEPGPGATALPPEVAPPPSSQPTPPPSAAPSGGPATPPPDSKNVPIRASAHLEKLTALGLDPKNLPPFDKLTGDQKKKVMPLFKQSLGFAECSGCHQEGDFKKVTKKMKIARGMWDHFAVGLRREGGEALFCDSCHGGREEPIDDDDLEALKKFMATEYVGNLERKDGKAHDCKTCHGDKLELDIIGKLWKID